MLDLSRIKHVPLSESQYVKEETKKVQIVLHHTAGNSSGVATIKNWNSDDRGRIATCVTISGKGLSKDTDPKHKEAALLAGDAMVNYKTV